MTVPVRSAVVLPRSKSFVHRRFTVGAKSPTSDHLS